MKPKTTTQTPGGKGGSASQNTAAHSSSRPGGACKYPIQSSAPKSPKNIRG
jgi:hypothetical protein